MTNDTPERVALAISHPGHELRLIKWLGHARPLVFLLTTGSRHGTSRQRVEASRRLIGQLGGTPSTLFGERLDRDVYAWIMAGDAAPFIALADRLADAFIEARVTTVLTDAWQHYNVVHDLWHLTVRVAVSTASRKAGMPIACYDYPVVPHGQHLLPASRLHERYELAADEVENKLALAHAYPEIAEDVAEVIEVGGLAALQIESLHDVRPVAELAPCPGEKPLYEHFGEERVAAGLYASVLRWSHVEPVYRSLCAKLIETEFAL